MKLQLQIYRIPDSGNSTLAAKHHVLNMPNIRSGRLNTRNKAPDLDILNTVSSKLNPLKLVETLVETLAELPAESLAEPHSWRTTTYTNF